MDDIRYWVGINMSEVITPRRFNLLLSSFSGVKSIWEAGEERIKNIRGMEKVADSFCEKRDECELKEEMRRIDDYGLDIFTLEDSNYPSSLRTLRYPPPVLYVKGKLLEDDDLSISLVGTRKFTDYGRAMAEKIAKELVRFGFTVVSGMARGIDTFSHRAALAGKGRTVAVLGSGFSNVYPKSNVGLMRRIKKSGAVISEYSCKQRPTKWSFPQRNRIISGLSRGTVVVEAPKKSGSLITARCALDQGREVFAIPGDARRKSSKGTHELIKDGAKLVEGAEDVVEEFPDLRAALPLAEGDGGKVEDKIEELDSDQKKVYLEMDYEPSHFDDLVESTGFLPARLSHIIFELQMKEMVKKLEGNRWIKIN